MTELSETTLTILGKLRELAGKQREARDAAEPSRFDELNDVYEETLRQIRVLAMGGEI